MFLAFFSGSKRDSHMENMLQRKIGAVQNISCTVNNPLSASGLHFVMRSHMTMWDHGLLRPLIFGVVKGVW